MQINQAFKQNNFDYMCKYQFIGIDSNCFLNNSRMVLQHINDGSLLPWWISPVMYRERSPGKTVYCNKRNLF